MGDASVTTAASSSVAFTGTTYSAGGIQYIAGDNLFTLRAFWKRLYGTVSDLMSVKEDLDNGVSHLSVAYPRPSRDCKWKCQFFAVCPLVDDGSAVEDMISAQYEIGNPNARYEEEKKGVE